MAQPLGLQNIGNSCYLNSLVQCLLCCDEFNKFVFTMKPNKFTQAYSNIYQSGGNVQEILNFVIESMQGHTHNLQFGTQEDSNEGFVLLMDALSKYGEVNDLFNIRYVSQYHCTFCDRISNNITEKCEIFISYDDKEVSLKEFLHIQTTRIPDYTCEGCKKMGGVIQTKRLCRISNTVVVLLKKYMHKEQISLPKTFDVRTYSGVNEYKLVATIEHYGTQNGGHYVAQGVRNGREYLFNDSSVHQNNLTITPNTYIVFYQT